MARGLQARINVHTILTICFAWVVCDSCRPEITDAFDCVLPYARTVRGLLCWLFAGKSCWQSLEVSSPISGPPLYAGIDEQGNARDKTVADWFSWIKPVIL